MWRYDEYNGTWFYDGYTEIYLVKAQRRIYEYPVSMHMEKLYLSITEAAIATQQRIDRDNFQEQRWQKDF